MDKKSAGILGQLLLAVVRCNMNSLALLGLVSGYILQNFGRLLLQIKKITSFVPMLTDTGGTIGSQLATLVMRV